MSVCRIHGFQPFLNHCPYCTQTMSAPEFDLDCGDSSCYFAAKRNGMRTNGGCRCLENNPKGVERYARRMKLQHSQDMARVQELVTALEKIAAERDSYNPHIELDMRVFDVASKALAKFRGA